MRRKFKVYYPRKKDEEPKEIPSAVIIGVAVGITVFITLFFAFGLHRGY
jgi:hypothetical protein